MNNEIEHCLDLLHGHKFDDLDRFLCKTQSEFEHGNISEIKLTEIFSTFCSTEAWLEPVLKAYIDHSPNSYTSNLAYGIYCIEYGWTKRGYDFADKLSENQITGFASYLQVANEHLRLSLMLTEKPILSYVQLMIIAMGIGEQTEGDKLRFYQSALECQPDCLGIRKQFLRTLRPQWGGSFEEMSDYVSDTQHLILSPSNYSLFLASKHFIDAHYYYVIEPQMFQMVIAVIKGGMRSGLARVQSLF